MQKQNTAVKIATTIFRHVAPWVVGIALFWGVCYHFFAPQSEGKSLNQGDVTQYAGMSHDIHLHRQATGEDPQWTGNMFSGMPAYLIDVEYPTQDVKQTIGSTVKLLGDPMNMIFFAMLLMMVAVVLMGVNPWIGIIAGLAYGLSTYFFLIIEAGHITKMWALVYAPPLVAAVWYALRRNMWVGAVLAALFGSLELGANHPQITYYFLLACLALWLSEAWFAYREKVLGSFGKRTALLLAAAILAVASNFAPLWYTMEHQKYTTRGVAEATDEGDARADRIAYNTQWSYGKAESFNMLVANYMGESSMGAYDDEIRELLNDPSIANGLWEQSIRRVQELYKPYYPEITREEVEYYLQDAVANEFSYTASSAASKYWGRQPFTAGPTYLGAAVVFFAILGILLTSARNRWWIIAVSLLALLLAWGSNLMGFYELTFDYLPGYSKFRTVSMALVVIEWSAPLLAALALWELWRTERTLRQTAIRVVIAAGVVVVMVAAMAFIADYGKADIEASMGNTWWSERISERICEARRDAFLADAWRTLLYTLLAGGTVIIYAWLRNRGSLSQQLRAALPYALVGVAGLLIVGDLAGINDRYLNRTKWTDTTPTDIRPTAADREILEDEDLGFRVLDLSVGDAYQSARASYFHRSVGGYHGAKLGRYMDVIKEYLDHNEPTILAALNTRYVITREGAKTLEEYCGTSPLGAAWLVERSVECPTPAEELELIGVADLATTAVVAEGSGLDAEYDTSGNIGLVEYAPNYLRYEYDSSTKSLAVFSEIYFADGWTAYIDNKEAEYFAADYILRGMELPAGKHTIEWRYRAPRWGMTTAVTGIASWTILLGCVAVAAWLVIRRTKGYKNEKNAKQ